MSQKKKDVMKKATIVSGKKCEKNVGRAHRKTPEVPRPIFPAQPKIG